MNKQNRQSDVIDGIAIVPVYAREGLEKAWELDHAPSGHHIATVTSQVSARRLRRSLQRLLDWTTLKDPNDLPQDTWRKARGLLSHHQQPAFYERFE